MSDLVIINGPNLNLVGIRQPEIYGSQSFDKFLPGLRQQFLPLQIHYLQSNHEGLLIDWLHEFGFNARGIVLNAGGLTHTSVALADAVASITTPVAEVHLSNIYERESFRHHSYLNPVCAFSVIGKGMEGYREALLKLLEINSYK